MKSQTIETNSKRNEFLSYIVISLQMRTDEFMNAVLSQDAPEKCYEKLIYKWILKLFNKGKTKEEALRIIHKARIFIMIRKSQYKYTSPEYFKNLQDLLVMLNSNSEYKKLNPEEKLIVQKKIEELTNTNSAKEIITQALESIDPIVKVEKDNNKIFINRGTLDRIKHTIKKINLKNYWKQRKSKE